MCRHILWPTSVSHPYSSLNSSLGFAGGNITRKLLSLSLDLLVSVWTVGWLDWICLTMTHVLQDLLAVLHR